MAEGAAAAEDYAELRALPAPVGMAGPVIRGFGRGSKQLGIPTANLDAQAQGGVVDALPAGVYFGWASVGASADVHKMVMSIGWCVRRQSSADLVAASRRRHHRRHAAATAATAMPPPPPPPALSPPRRNPYYGNERKTIEPHLLHAFERDFYGEELRLLVTGYLRPEKNYPSLEALIAAIHADIKTADEQLAGAPHAAHRAHVALAPGGPRAAGESEAPR